MKNKIEELRKKYPNEIDLISLNALLSVKKTEEVENTINELLKNLINKYPKDYQVKELEKFTLKKEIFLDFLLELKLEYPTDIDIISLIGINAMEESEEKSIAIDKLLKKLKDKYSNNIKLLNIVGYSNGIIMSGISISDNYRMYQGAMKHGYAGENVNNLYDNILGKNAKIVGADNAKNGPDRSVDGNLIQTKFCSSGRSCINQCFDKNGNFKYIDNLGKPMKIEVPKDKYEEAIRVMREKIEAGKIPNVSDPNKANEIVKQSPFTYNQAKNIAKFGTIESLTFDAVEGVKIAGTTMIITSAISFAYSIWSGEKYEEALKSACVNGIKVGGITWVSNIAAKQMARTGVMKAGLKSGSDYIVKAMGSKTAAKIVNSLRIGSTPIYGGAAINSLSKMLRGNVITGIATTIVLSSADVFRFFNGNVSGAQLGKNITKTGVGVAGGTAGWVGGAATGAALGSFVPIIGTGIGGFIGGVTGAFLGGGAAQKVADIILDDWLEIKDDIEIMLDILNKVFGELAFEYLLSEKEIEIIIGELKSLDLKSKMMDMYASSNRQEYARKLLKTLIEEEVKSRKKVKLPKDQDLLEEIKKLYDTDEITSSTEKMTNNKDETNNSIFGKMSGFFNDSISKNLILNKMIDVSGGKFISILSDEEIKIPNLEVSKYQITQDIWVEIMKNNPSECIGEKLPVENITWWEALEFCNKLSEKEGFQPVYQILWGKVLKINQKNGEAVNPNLADFSKTEGYRLPTQVEWEWFSRGGKIAIEKGTFDTDYAGSQNINEISWHGNNSIRRTHEVGTKKPNELGIYDCNGNIWEWCFDTSDKELLKNKKSHVYNENNPMRILKGGSCYSDVVSYKFRNQAKSDSKSHGFGFRIVRTSYIPDVPYKNLDLDSTTQNFLETILGKK